MHFVLCFCCLLVANDDNDSDQNGTSFTNKRKTYTQILIWLILCANPLDCICSRSRSKKMFFFGLPYCEIFKWMADWWSWTIELMMLMDMCLCSFIFFFIIATLVLLYSWRKRRKWKKNIFFGNAYNIQWSSKWCTIHITYYTHPFGVRTFWFCLNWLDFDFAFRHYISNGFANNKYKRYMVTHLLKTNEEMKRAKNRKNNNKFATIRTF